ncbi:hypothetical protein [Parendozoicomonas sp. Alg238-R29]|uniref:hypothetical protein n=1 Tax=Parendozoicomonas sp. Alg238-R29 TaxID=2993446 RepID=UPI00248ECBCE|nr:hypothetical protein [Parendozoicomonas sp. Alg238-R29]
MNITGKRQSRFYPDENILEVNIPIQLLRRGGRTRIQTADGELLQSSPTSDTALMRALAQAHIWLQKLEDGEFSDVKTLAAHYQQNESYVSRILRLAMLSPVLQEEIITGQHIAGRSLADFMTGVPVLWSKQ